MKNRNSTCEEAGSAQPERGGAPLPHGIHREFGDKRMNRKYELMFIVRPDMVDGDLNKLISTLESSVTSAGGTTKSEVWGKRRLAYKEGRFNHGSFVLVIV